MNTFVIALFALIAAANAGAILEGPSSRTSILGPDGSAIHSVAPGGVVATEHALPVAPLAYSAPILAPYAAYHPDTYYSGFGVARFAGFPYYHGYF